MLTPIFGTSALFACLIEVGFSGGHGTAGAMAGVFADLGFPAGGPLGQMAATVGLVVGVLGGVALIQYGVRRGFTHIGADADGTRRARQACCRQRRVARLPWARSAPR